MDEEEQEDLLAHSSDSDSSTDDPDINRVISCPLIEERCEDCCCFRKRIEFICTGSLCLLSATSLLILLPLYIESSNQVGNVYTTLLFTSLTTTTLILFISCTLSKVGTFSVSPVKPPFRIRRLAQAGVLQGLGGLCVVYALDRQRVVCHLQDPMKAIILVFSLVYYFCFSKKIMGLQKIFCATTVIVGLFVSVDYALCDEFHCRGQERERVEEDIGQWSRFAHFLWSLNYIGGLALWSMHFSSLEADVVGLSLRNPLAHINPRSLLETISCVVSTQDQGSCLTATSLGDSHHRVSSREEAVSHHRRFSGNFKPSAQLGRETHQMLENSRNTTQSAHSNSPSTFAIILWVNFFSLICIACFFWADLVPFIGKSSSWLEFLNFTRNGILCHFKSHSSLITSSYQLNTTVVASASCSSVARYGWLFSASLLIFSLSACHFLILSQSSVFTVALTSAALPFGNIFWSLFRLIPISGGIVEWRPNITAELVCSLLGIPIICTGLILLCKTHWTNSGVQKELCCTLRYHPPATSA